MKLGFRKIEAIVMTLILVILGVFLYEVFQAEPVVQQVFGGFIPQKRILHHGELTMALGIVGATVMPHNLYLGSSISQTRKYNRQSKEGYCTGCPFCDLGFQFTAFSRLFSQLSIADFGKCLILWSSRRFRNFYCLYDALKDPNIAGKVPAQY